MSKTAAFFIPYFWTPHIETDLELVHRHIEAGDRVVLFICESELAACYSNRTHDLAVCTLCKGRRRNALNLTDLSAKVEIRNFVNLTPADVAILEKFKGLSPATRDELLAVKLDDCFIGKTIFNELCSFQNDIQPSVEFDADYITRTIESAALVYLSFKNHFSQFKPDILYTFNGRFAIAQPAIIAAQAAGINYAVHDRAGAINHFWLVENQSMHSIRYYNVEARRLWKDSIHSDEEKYRIGSAWYDERVADLPQSWFSFTSEQTVPLPDGFDPNKTNIVIFNSSEWEVAVMDDYVLRLYDSQNSALVRIAEDLQHCENIEIYLRVHPYLKGTNNSQLAFIERELTGKFRNFHVIPADSPVKSYSLMRNAAAVLSFGSTTGIEAAYHGIPSFLLGPSWYEDLDACFKPASHEELLQLITTEQFRLTPAQLEQRKLEAVIYGYFSQESGEVYTIFKQTGIFEIEYLGKNAPARTVSNDLPGYNEGLGKELQSRQELRGKLLNPLASTVSELQQLADTLVAENVRLQLEIKDQLALAAQADVSQPQPGTQHRLAQLRRRISQKVRTLFT